MMVRVVFAAGALLLAAGCDRQSQSPIANGPDEQSSDGRIEPKIVRGRLVEPGRLLGVVGLTYGNAREPLCTGALIARDMVLTAAHCVCRRSPSHIFVGQDPGARAAAAAGRYYPAGKWRAALRCGEQTSANGVDIAVVRIAGQVGVTEPLSFASATVVENATFFPIAGYGATDTAGAKFDYRKRAALVPRISQSCTGAGEADRYRCQPGEIVAGQLSTPDTCLGDSGGPLLVGVPSAGEDGVAIAGVTSRGVRAATKCGAGGIYERVHPHRNWIDQATASLRSGA